MARHGLGPENNAWVREIERRLAEVERGRRRPPRVNQLHRRTTTVDFPIPEGVIAPTYGESVSVELGIVVPPPWAGGCVVSMGAPAEGTTDACTAQFEWVSGGFSSTLWELSYASSTAVRGDLAFSARVSSNTIDAAPWEPERLRFSILWTGVSRD